MDASWRSSCRAQLTKICNSIEEYLSDQDGENAERATREEMLNVFLQRLGNAHDKLKAADEALRKPTKEDDLQREHESIIEYDDKAVSMIAKLKFNLKQLSSGAAGMNKTCKNGEDSGIKLKAIEIKKFDGNFENWLPFWEQFKQAVDENNSLAAAAKFNFLSEALTGRAAASIAGFTPTERCYNDAIALLQEEYGNTEKIVEKFVQKLLNIKAVQSPNDTKGLRALYNEINATMRCLTALDVPSSQYEIMVKSILLKSIPASMRTEFHRNARRGKENMQSTLETVLENTNTNVQEGELVKSLLEFLRDEVEAREKSQLSEGDDKRSADRERRAEKEWKGTAIGLYTNSNVLGRHCVFCKASNHESKNCQANMSVAQRKQILKGEGRCFRCTNRNHSSKFCKGQWMKCATCGGRHLTPMCEREQKEGNKGSGEKREHSYKPSTSTAGTTLITAASTTALNTTNDGEEENEIYLQTAKAIMCDEDNTRRVLCRLIMDNGSQRTYISEKLANKLKLPVIAVENTQIIAFGENQNKQRARYNRVNIKIKSQYSDEIVEISATVVPTICADILPAPKIKNKTLSKMALKLADNIVSSAEQMCGINMLIGQDHLWKFSTAKSEKISPNLVAVETFFGWTIQGHVGQGQSECVLSNFQEIRKDEFNIEKFWNLESVGIVTPNTEVGKYSVPKINSASGRYVVELPWKSKSEQLNDNKNVAISRLRVLINKLLKNKSNLRQYHDGMQELLNARIAEKVPSEASHQRVCYLPHMPVYRDDKVTTKMRIVFDASSSETGLSSLNDHLSAGHNLVADLLTMLVRFRSNKIAIVSDIEKAFLQIELRKEDRDSHRFLWYKALPESSDPLPDILELRMTRVTFGVTSSPFLLAATIKRHLEQSKRQYGAICDKLQRSFYVDDLVTSVNDQEEALTTVRQATTILGEAKFNLRKWNSNNVAVKQFFTEQNLEAPTVQKVLGISWCTTTDEVNVDLSSIANYIQSLRATKRNVLRAMAKIYDPLGTLGPFTVNIKILLQNIWKENLNWDSSLSGEILQAFQRWQEDLSQLIDFTLPRSLVPFSSSCNQIHIFADASPRAYGAVAYIRAVSPRGDVTTRLICSKNRVSPLKKCVKTDELTLPKLELTAALIASRLKEFLLTSVEFRVDAVFLWSDSSIALSWIHGHGKHKPYITTRVDEIKRLTNIYDWRHCEGKTNPADLLTRGVRATTLATSDLWRNGPSWLSQSQQHWPAASVCETNTALLATRRNNEATAWEPILPLEKFSHLKRILRITAFVLRFVRLIKESVKAPFKRTLTTAIQDVTELSASEIQQAELYWVKHEQQQLYAAEIAALTEQRALPANSKITSLHPFLVDGVLKLRGRLPSVSYWDRMANPAILPKNSHLSKLLISEAHHATLHSGVNAVLTQIRRKYWIVQGRQAIKRILQRCVTCKRLHGKSGSEPWTSLPAERAVASRPFETTGIDFAGPLYVKAGAENQQEKVYILLLTCAGIRAVHLELVRDMTVKSCMNALRKFFARRGVPRTIISDNAKTFKRIDMELSKLEKLLKGNEIQQLAAHKGITWKFIPERAAWWGGFWERLVRSVKTCLKAAIGKLILTADELSTLLTEVEGVINQRPLTYISSDCKDLEPLTPSHFLNGGSGNFLHGKIYSDGTAIGELWQARQTLLNRYLKRWRNEYLGQLRGLHQNKPKLSRSINVGDVVLVGDDDKARLLWRLAVVESIYMGRDGRARACNVRVRDGGVLRRPVQHLYPLEISATLAGAEDVEN